MQTLYWSTPIPSRVWVSGFWFCFGYIAGTSWTCWPPQKKEPNPHVSPGFFVPHTSFKPTLRRRSKQEGCNVNMPLSCEEFELQRGRSWAAAGAVDAAVDICFPACCRPRSRRQANGTSHWPRTDAPRRGHSRSIDQSRQWLFFGNHGCPCAQQRLDEPGALQAAETRQHLSKYVEHCMLRHHAS